jgi:hypothetical protein
VSWLKRRLKGFGPAFSTTDKRLRRIERAIGEIQQALGGMGIRGQLRHLDLQAKALLRAQYLSDPGNRSLLQPSYELNSRRFHYWSQNEEDGLTLAIFAEIGAVVRRFIEFGCGSNGGNSGFLAAELGWSGLMVDGDEAKVKMCREAFPDPNVRVVHRWIAVENVNGMVTEQGLGGEVDFLSIDLDGNDYWIWKALTACLPRLVVMEYNSAFGPERAVAVPYRPDFDRKNYSEDNLYFGASLAGLEKLGIARGYRLIAVEPRGTNAYFLRNDVPSGLPTRTCRELYHPLAKYFRRVECPEHLFRNLERRGLPLIEV